jgi:secreted PhoX family phosphatase
MSFNRRQFLTLFGASTASIALSSVLPGCQDASAPVAVPTTAAIPEGLNFRPVAAVMPLATDATPREKQLEQLARVEIKDDLVLPEGYAYQVVATWGDKVGDGRFGYNNDYVSFVPTSADEGFLTVNFEYISPRPWLETIAVVAGKELPIAAATAALSKQKDQQVDVASLEDARVAAQCREIAQEALADLGIGVLKIKRNAQGQWERVPSAADRRITGLSGYSVNQDTPADAKLLKSTGPATEIFRKQDTISTVRDDLGDRIIGTFGNCAGGTTPWGTVLSAEENFQNLVSEPVYADGTPFPPSAVPFTLAPDNLDGLGNPFALAGHKYGWIVEVDPSNPQDYGTKHTWLGRYRHEAVGIRVTAGKPLAFYSGCDRRGGHLYKFVSKAPVRDPKSKENSQLLTEGMLYAAKFNPDGTGTWLPLRPETPINPDLPSDHIGGMLPLPKRPDGGVVPVTKDEDIATFKQQFATLADLYQGTPQEQQGAILIDAHYAANAIGATGTARPEDTVVDRSGALFIAYTSGVASKDSGGPNKLIFRGPDNSENYEHGWIMRLDEDQNDPAALKFRWQMMATGGEPSQGGMGFSNPDNLAFDPDGNLWMVTDMSGTRTNQPVPVGRQVEGQPLTSAALVGLYGNNSIWKMPLKGEQAGKAFLFGYGPMECETTGPCFTDDGKTLFLAVQHPGEIYGTRRDGAQELRTLAMKTVDGQEFLQSRIVPLGSNWPAKTANTAPRPAVVAIYRLDGAAV